MALAEKSKMVWQFLKDHDGEKIIAADIAEALGFTKKAVDACVTRSLQQKGYSTRTEAQIKTADGTIMNVKFIALTDAGRNLNPDAAEA